MATINWDDPELFKKYISPYEDSPNKGSRDLFIQNLYGHGAENLGNYFVQNQGDPTGIFSGVDSYLASLAPQNIVVGPDDPRYNSQEWNPGNLFPSNAPLPQFKDFTLEQYRAFLDKQKNDYIAAGNPNNDAMWMPTYQDINGIPNVTSGKRNTKEGFLTQLGEMLPYIAGSAVTGMGFSDLLGAFSAGAGVGAPGTSGLGAGATGAFDMGIGGVGEAMGLGGVAEGLGLGFDGMSMPGFGGGGGMSVPAADIASVGAGGFGGSPFETLGGVGGGGFGLDQSMWGDVAQGWEGMQAGSAAQNASLAANPLQQTIEQLKTLAVNPQAFGDPMKVLGDKFLKMKDPMSLIGGVTQWMQNKKNVNQMEEALKQFQQQGFPHQNFYGMAQDYLTNPAKRYAYLQGTPGFLASQDYVKEAQRRKNAGTGDLSSGYGDALTATMMGQNAASWDDQLFKQIAQASGMQFNNQDTNARLTGSLLPAMFQQQQQGQTALGNAVRNNQGFLPEIFRTVLS